MLMPAMGQRGTQQRRVIHFSGMVQGVGFRYTALRVAAGFEVAGYVRNLRDGRVEVVAEGRAEQIDAFLDDLTGRMRHYIRDVRQDVGDPTGQYAGFDVRF